MKIYVLKYFFNGDDVENETKGVYTDKDKAIIELEKLVKYENENNISEYDEPFRKADNKLRYQGYVQHLAQFIMKLRLLILITRLKRIILKKENRASVFFGFQHHFTSAYLHY